MLSVPTRMLSNSRFFFFKAAMAIMQRKIAIRTVCAPVSR